MPARNHIDLVLKTMRVLETLAGDAETTSLKQIAQETQLVKSSAYRILYSLQQLGYVEQGDAKGTYRLTWKMVGLARRSARRVTLANVARPHLIRLRDEVWESAWLAEWRQTKAVMVDVVEASRRLQLSLDVGSDCPLHATAIGKAIAAYLPPQDLDTALGPGRLPTYTVRTVRNRRVLRLELARVRRLGYAINMEESIPGAFLLGAPLFNSAGAVCGALSVSAPVARLTSEKRTKMIAAVKSAAKAVNEELASLRFVAHNGSRIGG